MSAWHGHACWKTPGEFIAYNVFRSQRLPLHQSNLIETMTKYYDRIDERKSPICRIGVKWCDHEILHGNSSCFQVHAYKQFRGAVGKIMVISKVTLQLEKMTKAINIVLLN
jgi:hypothetical protein